MEALILIIGLFVFFESDSKDIVTTKSAEKISDGSRENIAVKMANQDLKFEVVNKNGIWIFAPVQQKKEANIMNLKKQNSFGQFITLPDGSKIERGF